MSDIDIYKIIKRWINYAFDNDRDNTVLEKFVYIWFAFNAYYGEYLYYRDRRNGAKKSRPESAAIKLSIRVYQEDEQDFLLVKAEDCFNSLKDLNVENVKFEYNLSEGDPEYRENTRYQNEREDVNSDNPLYWINGYLRIIYGVRCNLFHGSKHVYDEREFSIISYATECLCWLLFYFSHNSEIEIFLKNHETKWRGLAEREIAAYLQRNKHDYSNYEP